MTAAQSAVAQVAYTASTSIYIIEESAKTTPHQPILTREVTHLQSQSIKNIFNESTNLTILPANTDPFSKLLGGQATANGGALISVLASSKSLIPAIPHLYKIANGSGGSEGGDAKLPAVVIHVAVDCNPENNLGDYADVMAIRQTGFAILQSTGGQEALDVALIAHALAIKTGVPVLHFFDASSTITSAPGSRETPKYFGNDAIAKFIQESGIAKHHENYQETTKDQQSELYFRPVKSNNKEENSEFFFTQAQEIFTQFKKIVGRSYGIAEFSGDNEAESLIITLGSGSTLIQRAFRRHPRPKAATIKVRLYRPWSDKHLLTIIPKSIKKVVVLEQVSTKRATTKWTPLYLDVTAAFQNREHWSGEAPFMVGGQYGALSDDESVDTAVAEVFLNLGSSEPQREFIFGKLRSQNGPQGSNGIVATINEQPALEKQYVKILEEVFSERLFIANAISQPTVGHHHLEAAVKTTPEFGFGVLLAKLQERAKFTDLVSQVVRDSSIKIPDPLHDALSQWHSNKNDATLASKHGDSAVKSLAEIHASHALLSDIYTRKDQFQKPANWLIGSDVWAYDVGNSGVHHVISSGKDINLLIIDSQPYTTRTAADPEKRKKDIGLYAMNYGDVYVASIAVYSSFTQVLHAFMEAEKFPGPSVVLAYLPYHTESDTTITVLKETKLAVDAGYWPLYRWNPELEKQGQEPFTLDSERIKQELQAFLDRENHLTQVVQARPELASSLVSSLESEIATKQKSIAKSAYEKLLGGLTGPPLLILFGSDNGNAEGLARTLQKGAVARGVNARCTAMDEYPIEELGTEKNLVIVCCTAGQGEFPQNGREFWKTISSTTDISLAETQYTVFGLGDSHYWPRPEDAIYYNKPGKELDARLELLGGKRLLRLGLGDDQDPDGYETAFRAWEPELWEALGVELLGTVVVEPKKTDDDMKVESNYLRGTIAEGLEDTSTGALTERDTKLTKFHGIYQQDDRDLREERKAQGMEKAFMFMVRVRVPGGVSTPEQWLAMDEISDSYANGSIKLTTRQAFQLHGVVKRNLKSTIRDINKCLLDTLAACGDVNRNVMCNPNPYLSEVHDQIYEFSKQLSAHLSPQTTAYHEIWLDDKMVAGRAVQDYEPLYGPTYLPRKFKIVVAVPPNNDVDVFAHDLGFIAIADQNGKLAGYNVTVGGGMGMTHNNKKTYPRLGDIIGFCTPEQAVDVGEKVMLVQRDFGDRTNRKHARLKYTIDDRSVEWFKEELESRLGYKLQPERAYTFDSNGDRYGWTKGVNGRWHFCMYIENGRVVDLPGAHIKTGLREIARIHKGDFRLTPNQHLILGNIPEGEKPRIETLLKKYGLDNLKYTGLRLNSMACVALPTCGLAMAESERYLPTLVSKLEEVVEEVGLSHDAITIRMTGCPNGCARPYVAEIAFVGKAPGTYNVYLGGGFYGQRLNKLYKESLKEDDIMRELRSMLTRYVKERDDGEKFGDFAIRTGYVKATTAGKNFHE